VCLVVAWSGPAEPEPSSLASGNTEFAFALYSRLSTRPGNLAFSPFSISTALAMTYAGTTGETASEMARVLHFPPQPHAAFQALLAQLGKPSDLYKLSMANRIWPSLALTLRPAFSRLLETCYQAKPQPLDYRQPQPARQEINRWVSQQTQGKIPELLSPQMVDSRTLLVLTNAIYFQGSWSRSFDPADTRQEPFVGSDGTRSLCWIMKRSDAFLFAELEQVQVLEMPYVGGLSMVLILPPGNGGLSALERKLDATLWRQWMQSLSLESVLVRLPRFTLEGEFQLPQTLRELGMQRVFSGEAEMGAMTNSVEPAFVSECIHKAVVEVNEQGTVAAAATAVSMTRGLHRSFEADHPFLFVIWDRSSESILFMGRVERP
jgi:serpin B